MLRIGRTVINQSEVVKVVSDDRSKSTTVYFKGGVKASYKKHAAAVWNYFKSATQIGVPSSSSRSRW